MGNCIRKTSSMEWGGEEWGSFGSGHKTRGSHGNTECMQESSLLGESKGMVSCSLAAAATEVKIKISKKELEKLLKEADLKGLPVQQVLARLMDVGGHFEAHHKRPWKPALHSIPE